MTRLNLGSGEFHLMMNSSGGRRQIKTFKRQHGLWVHLGCELDRSKLDAKAIALYELIDYRPWFFKRGDKLPFGDGAVGFILAEHFLEHLLLVEAAMLLDECFRVLCDGGVLRVAVPDAIFGPSPEHRWLGRSPSVPPANDPKVHKMRWTVHSLSEAMASAGFTPQAILFYDRDGTLHDNKSRIKDVYGKTSVTDPDAVFSFKYVNRRDRSLIVDGFKGSL